MRKKSILCIGVPEKSLSVLGRLLSPLEYRIVSAAESAQAGEILLNESGFNAALIALESPHEVQKSIDLTLQSDIPAIVMGNGGDEAFREKVLEEDIVDYISTEKKEHLVDIAELIKRIQQNRHSKILVVDDSRSFRTYMAELLKVHRFSILEAAGGLEALDTLHSDPEIELIITDHEMPGMNGLELIRRVRGDFSTTELPIIVISTIGQKSTIAKCLKNGANDYLHKPFEREEFFSRIYLTLSHKKNIDTLRRQKRLLEKFSEDLEDTIKQRTSELQAANDELEAYRKHLECRVTEEVEKNRIQTSQMLQQSRLAQMGEMISMIAHQWRQPLAAISTISGTLSVDVMMDEYNKEFFEKRLATITELSQHLSRTIDDFRGFFKQNKKRQTTTFKTMVIESLSIIEPMFKAKSIAIHTALDDDTQITTYPNEVKQVILNILKNAEEILLEKSPEEPKIWITNRTEGEYAALYIKDNAGGIADGIIENVFDPYFSTKKKKDGTGLGLYMSKTIIDDHCGGHLDVRNAESGALFKITLPLHPKEHP